MLVTINTDASFDWDLKIGAFAYWIRCDTGKLFSRGPFKCTVADSSEAEFMAVVKAIHRLANSKWKNIEKIIINTDCLVIIKYMKEREGERSKSKLNKRLMPVLDIYKSLINVERLKHADIEFRHVKAHVKTDDARTWANAWCDKSAKLSLNEMRELLNSSHERSANNKEK